jgi:diaminopimelate epimerase
MKVFDAQGPEADMCGNGIRCAGAYLGTKLNKTELKVRIAKEGLPASITPLVLGIAGYGNVSHG